jgi:hypothetical protein
MRITYLAKHVKSIISNDQEWAEGALLLEWLSSRRILTKDELLPFVTIDEYFGALSDLSGELGRLAVNRAAGRDRGTVQEVLLVDVAINSAMDQVGDRYSKKFKAVQNNLKKVEDLVYELTLSERGGRKISKSSSSQPVGKEASGEADAI